jgi:protocatechuate 3,4-dioxygenase beta subunit
MNKVLVPLFVLVLAALAYLFFFDDGAKPLDPDAGGQSTPPILNTENPLPEQGEAVTGPQSEGVEPRAESTQPSRQESQPQRTREEHQQGVRGRVISSQSAPVVGAKIYLVKTLPTGEMLSALVRAAQAGARASSQVGASGETVANGRFEISAPPSAGARSYELHVVAPGHEIHKQPIRLSPEKWEELPLIRLTAARKLTGVVRDVAKGAPIEGAVVRVDLPATNMLQATPGMEDGAQGITDKAGRYTVDHLPMGTFTAKAFARGYGTQIQGDITFGQNDLQQTADFQLGEGFVIEGRVVDAMGKGIARARVEAQPYSRENPTPSSGFTDEEGNFALLGLAEGSYAVIANAPGYLEDKRQPVQAARGATTANRLQLVLETLGQARVTVSNKSGAPVKAFRLELRSYFENQETFGRTTVAPQELRAGRDGSALFTGIPPGQYVFQATSIGYAKTYSDSFLVAAGATAPVEVRIRMNEGGTIEGIVTDSSGNPISGVGIKTLENTYQANPFFEQFKAFMPEMITHTSVSTDEQGRYTLKKLTPGTYQIEINHPSYTRAYKKDIQVNEGQKTVVEAVRLAQGGTVSGKVFFQGRPVIGAEVMISSAPGGEGTPMWEKAFTGPDGSFKVSRPLPAGTYSIHATRTDVANPFLKMKDIQTSKKELRVFDGRDNPVQIHIKQ